MAKNENAAALGKLGGDATSKGKWWERLTAEERKASARKAGQARAKSSNMSEHMQMMRDRRKAKG